MNPYDIFPEKYQVPNLVLMNLYKHHAGVVKDLIDHAVDLGHSHFEALNDTVKVLGENLMDLYIGELTPKQIAEIVLKDLEKNERIESQAFQAWVDQAKGYQVIDFDTVDQSRWVLRLTENSTRYVHIHPGRWSPATLRVRAHTLKTAILTLVDAKLNDLDPFDVKRVNELRVEWLELSPIREVVLENGLGKLMNLFLQN